LAAAWYAPKEGLGTDIEAFVLVCYLRLYHPEVHRLLTYDPDQVGTFHEVLMRDLNQEGVRLDAVRLLFLRAFRHARPLAGKPEKRADEDVVVDELIERLDRHKGDQAFLDAWRRRYADAADEDIVGELRPLLVESAS